MEQPRLPFWFYAGRVSTPINGPVFVMKPDGDVVEAKGASVVLTPRLRFFATTQAVSLLVKKKLVKRLPNPVPKSKDEPKAEAALAVAAPATKSESAEEQGSKDEQAASASSGDEQKADVIASVAGEGEAGKSSVPEEKESGKSARKKGRRS